MLIASNMEVAKNDISKIDKTINNRLKFEFISFEHKIGIAIALVTIPIIPTPIKPIPSLCQTKERWNSISMISWPSPHLLISSSNSDSNNSVESKVEFIIISFLSREKWRLLQVFNTCEWNWRWNMYYHNKRYVICDSRQYYGHNNNDCRYFLWSFCTFKTSNFYNYVCSTTMQKKKI